MELRADFKELLALLNAHGGAKMRVERNIAHLLKNASEEDNYCDLPPEQLLDFMWELTLEIWSLAGEENAESRLQRDVTALIRA